MRVSTFASFSLSVSAVFAAGACVGQQAPGAAAHSAQVQQVVLPVTVRDKHGALVTSVQKSDLTLTEDGRAQTIQSLTHDSDKPLRIGLLVDTSRGLTGALAAERKAAGDYVNGLLPAAGDSKNQAFLIHFDREVELLRDFTNNREKLRSELEDLGSTHPQQSEAQGPETVDDQRSAPRARSGDQLYDAIYLACDELMKDQHGRKALIVFSNGADHGSKETMNEAVDAADRANVAVYTIFFKGEAENRENNGLERGNRRGGGYPGGGYPGGGYPGGGGGYPGGGGRKTPEPTSATGIDGKKIMQEIATRTGGHAYEAKRTGDLDPIYKLIDEEMRGQYLLAFTPDRADTEGGFHKIAVTTDKKDWTVSTREGYYAAEK